MKQTIQLRYSVAQLFGFGLMSGVRLCKLILQHFKFSGVMALLSGNL